MRKNDSVNKHFSELPLDTSVNRFDKIASFWQNVNSFMGKFGMFSRMGVNAIGKVQENFSFSGLNTYRISNDLISKFSVQVH